MSDTVDGAIRDLAREGDAKVLRAFKQALGNVEGVSKDLCPVGHYGRKRGFGGRAGAALQNSLHVEFLGQQGTDLIGRCISPLPYARAQHEDLYFHPGIYTGAPGSQYEAKFFERAVAIIFGNGVDPAGDPGGQLRTLPAGFQELLEGA
ncbi:MAG TPA: hypothetical protein VGP72_14665 [Planctomycetota bacterium]|jgi:hypothetical protein